MNGLTHLTICNHPVSDSFRPSFGDVIATLSILPMLQDLRLEHVLPFATEVPGPWTEKKIQRVALNFLTSLRLTGHIHEVSTLLSKLSIPPRTSVALIVMDDELEPNFSGVSTTLASANGGYVMDHLRELSIEYESTNCIHIHGQLFPSDGQTAIPFPPYSHLNNANLAI